MKKTQAIILTSILVAIITFPFWNKFLPSNQVSNQGNPVFRFVHIEHYRNDTLINWKTSIISKKGDQIRYTLQIPKPLHFMLIRMNEDGTMLMIYPQGSKISDYISNKEKNNFTYFIEDDSPQRLFFFFSEKIIEFDTLRFEITFALRKYQDHPPSLAELNRLPFDWNYETVFIKPEK